MTLSPRDESRSDLLAECQFAKMQLRIAIPEAGMNASVSAQAWSRPPTSAHTSLAQLSRKRAIFNNR